MNLVGLAIGRRAAGKTTLLRRIAQENTRVILVDPVGTTEPVGALATGGKELASVLRRTMGGRFRVTFRPTRDEEIFSLMRWAWMEGDVILLVDEVDLYWGERIRDEDSRRILRYGRHRNVGFWGATRRPYSVGPDLRGSVTDLVVTKLTEPRDVNQVCAWIPGRVGGDHGGAAPEDAIPRLPQYHAVWTDFESTREMHLDEIARLYYGLNDPGGSHLPPDAATT